MELLRSKCCLWGLSKKEKEQWFTQNENKLIGILLHLAKPAGEVFIKAENIPEPLKNEVHMNRLLYNLYKKTKKDKKKVMQQL